MIQDIELAADADGQITAVRVQLLADMGAYLQLVTPGIPLLGAFLYHGVYDIPAYSFACTGVFTNRTPTDAYRGAGRPEATYAIERAIDALAAQDRRRPRRDPPAQLHPARTVPVRVGRRARCSTRGDYEPALDRALEMVGYEGVREGAGRAARSTGSTKQLGIGISTYVEMCGLAPSRVLASLQLRRRRLGGGDGPGAADRQGAGGHRARRRTARATRRRGR